MKLQVSESPQQGLAGKQVNLGKKSLCHYLILRWLVFIGIHSCDWLIHSSTRRYDQLALFLYYRKLVVKLLSVASRESLLVWLVWLFS